MRRIRRSHPRLPQLAAVLLLAACRDGGDGPVTAGADDLRLEIVAGKGIFSTVRPVGVQEGDSAVEQQPITVRVTVSPDRLEEAGATGPGQRILLPAVEMRWRAVQTWCQPVEAVTPVPAGADSVTNRVRRPTVGGHCQLVVEGVAEGRVFDTDTSVIDFGPGPPATVYTFPRMYWTQGFRPFVAQAIAGVQDAYGNLDTLPAFAAVITGGASVFSIDPDQRLRAAAEAYGEMELTIGTHKRRVQLWAVRELRRTWRITWACYGGAGAGGTQVDSVHHRLDVFTVRYGLLLGPGVAVTLEGNRAATTWVQGQPASQSSIPNTTIQVVQRPRELEWPNGRVSTWTGTRYEGGTLCESPPGGGAWARTSPLSMQQI